MEQNGQYADEIKHLKHLNSKLENDSRSNSGTNSGVEMPQILSVPGTVISSLARKVTNQITTQLSNSDSGGGGASHLATLSQFSDSDTLDDSMRKVNKYVRKRHILSQYFALTSLASFHSGCFGFSCFYYFYYLSFFLRGDVGVATKNSCYGSIWPFYGYTGG
jgi:hypothetical protein